MKKKDKFSFAEGRLSLKTIPNITELSLELPKWTPLKVVNNLKNAKMNMVLPSINAVINNL